MTGLYRLVGTGLAVASMAAGTLVSVGAGKALADPPMHQVVYVVSAQKPIYADIFYQDRDPAVYADYSHNPYEFIPQVHADISPGKPWVQPVTLAKPEWWAMVTVNTGREPGTPEFHCDLVVDGKVVKSNDGHKGVLCSLRTW